MRGLNATPPTGVVLRSSRPKDGAAMHALVERVGLLEQNTAYGYLLMADHFRSTCVVAERDGALVGLVIGYRPPSEPSALFVWQVGVDPSMRGQGLGRTLLNAFVQTPGGRSARSLLATVAPSNGASNKLFAAFAREIRSQVVVTEGYGSELFPPGHERECLLRIDLPQAHDADSSEVMA